MVFFGFTLLVFNWKRVNLELKFNYVILLKMLIRHLESCDKHASTCTQRRKSEETCTIKSKRLMIKQYLKLK